jgi:radical SAM protein with 4Fe4S-binding SPASM domain
MKYDYPSPCLKCEKKHCCWPECGEWLKRYRTRQKWINAWALRKAGQLPKQKTEVWTYCHPAEVQAYLEADPCRDCFAKPLCRTKCPRRKRWDKARQDRERKRGEHDL